MLKRVVVLGIVLIMVLSLTACGGQQGSGGSAQSPEEFFKGKTLNIVVPYTAGGGFDAYARLLEPYLKKNLPGTTVVVQNVPGAGGLTGINQVYRANPDGLTIGLGNIVGLLYMAVTGQEGVQYDFSKFTWFGRISSEPRVLCIAPRLGVNSVEDLKKLNRPIKIALTGVGSDDYYNSAVLFNALGIPLEQVPGWEGQAECNLAVVRGNVDGTLSTLSSVLTPIKSNELKPLLFIAAEPVKGFEKVPLATSLAPDDKSKQLLQSLTSILELDRSFIGPPGIPADRVEFLRSAFSKALTDPDFVAQAEKAKRPVASLEGKECEAKAKEAWAAADAMKEVLKGLTK